MDANLKGAWLVARAAACQMIAGGRGGSIINIASILGSAVQKATAPYSAAKAGLIHLTRSMALEWARHDIRVNALAPGYYHTDMASDYLESETGDAHDQSASRNVGSRAARTGRCDPAAGLRRLLVHDRLGGDGRRRTVAGRDLRTCVLS